MYNSFIGLDFCVTLFANFVFRRNSTIWLGEYTLLGKGNILQCFIFGETFFKSFLYQTKTILANFYWATFISSLFWRDIFKLQMMRDPTLCFNNITLLGEDKIRHNFYWVEFICPLSGQDSLQTICTLKFYSAILLLGENKSLLYMYLYGLRCICIWHLDTTIICRLIH